MELYIDIYYSTYIYAIQILMNVHNFNALFHDDFSLYMVTCLIDSKQIIIDIKWNVSHLD